VVKTKKAQSDLLAPPPAFTSTDVAKISGVSLRQLQWWDEKKVVSPRQVGHRRLYLAGEVLEIAVIAELRRKKFSLQKIRRVLRFLQKEVGRKLSDIMSQDSEMHLVTDGKAIYLEDNHQRIIDILKNSKQAMFLVCVSDQARRLSATLPPARKPVRSESTGISRKSKTV